MQKYYHRLPKSTNILQPFVYSLCRDCKNDCVVVIVNNTDTLNEYMST